MFFEILKLIINNITDKQDFKFKPCTSVKNEKTIQNGKTLQLEIVNNDYY